MKLYKVLDKEGNACHGGSGKWNLPTKNDDGTWSPGEWMPEIEGELVPCSNGYHLCRWQDLTKWLHESIYEAEHDGELVEDDNKVVVRNVRLLRKIETWNDKNARLFACDCAEHVLHIFEDKYPYDKCPREAIETARKFANGEATQEELAAAGAAAWAAAWAAAGDAAWAAARAGDAAGDAAWAAARAGARAAARAAAGAAAWVAAGDAEKEWQMNKLFEYLDGGCNTYSYDNSNISNECCCELFNRGVR